MFLISAGIRYVPVVHADCSQQSREEAEIVSSLVGSFLKQRFQDKNQQIHPLTLENILIVVPYNRLQISCISL